MTQTSSTNAPHAFAGNPLDRANLLRRDPAWLEERLRDPSTRIVAFNRLDVLIDGNEPPRLLWLDAGVLPSVDGRAEPIFLGLDGAAPRWALDVSSLDDPARALGLPEGARFAEVRAAADLLPGVETAIAAEARSLVDWHARHGYCAVCGQPTAPRLGGLVRKCDACNAEHYPRVDPVVIMVVTDGDRCLLAHGRGRPGRSYTNLAGFVEPGETIEEAVRREVREEADIEVAAVRYHSSQPWPFPSSLMIGCIAEAASERIDVDPEELEDVRWFSRADVLRALDGASEEELGFRIPPPITISHQLLKAWAAS